ncbi:post-GPI attachment to proteins factor 6 [Bufo gargarizans]|uniref:post-GPI attachment to proteins factor 6 n=1 Tax=Bufo gargarizans TaxID=30331 RepID=UPI001CF5DA84|nr:post-GPI attachment to proteins factor 6 [Bufo gargarizans]
METPILLVLLISLGVICPPAASVTQDLSYVTEMFSQSPQRLSFYSWYGNVRLFQFRVPADAVLLRWLLQAFRGNGHGCEDVTITVHFRYGAPPVINPLGYSFAPNTSVPSSFTQTMTFRNTMQSHLYLNISNPAPGDWFVAAHLPKDTEKIEIQGLTKSCTYIFQPELFVLREVEVPVLQADVPVQQILGSIENSARYKLFVPEYTRELQLRLTCPSNVTGCPLTVTVGSVTEPDSSGHQTNCSDGVDCGVVLRSPPWERWLTVLVEKPLGLSGNVSFQVVYNLSVCRPGSVGSRTFLTFLKLFSSMKNSTLLTEGQQPTTSPAVLLNEAPTSCLRKYPVIREELDVASVRFYPVTTPSVPVVAQLPSVVLLDLDSEMDSGGMLVVNLQLNKTRASSVNTTILACLSPSAPILALNATQGCTTAFSQGYSFTLSDGATSATQNIPYPVTDRWYISMQVLCPQDDSTCQQQVSRVIVTAYLSPCLDDCGTYGECRLLRRNGYLYAACSCKAGWGGWSCTDDQNALSVGQQLAATLFLTLSNLMFVPTIVVAIYHLYFVEAAVYTYTMFFSTFYHACDQPGVTVMCIMDYDTLQFCDFFGSVVAIWVTILCMARLKKCIKYVLFMLGTLVIAMSMQLNRSGIWNMLGPCLFALILLVIAWTTRGVRRRHCYPPSWRRWVFFLLPGIALALSAISVYVFAETNANYYYTHSLWHMMVATSVAFLLPPRERSKKTWEWSQLLDCGYKICKEDREELYVVT